VHHTGQPALVTLLGASINSLPVAVASMGALVVSAFSSERYFEVPQADAVAKASSWAFLPASLRAQRRCSRRPIRRRILEAAGRTDREANSQAWATDIATGYRRP